MTGAADQLVEAARRHQQAGRPTEALASALGALDADPRNLNARPLIARTLRHYPASVPPQGRDWLERLLDDPDIEPSVVARAAWRLLLAADGPLVALASDPSALARWAEEDGLAQRLLESCPVTVLDAERALSRLRRWLLVSRRWPDFPRLTAALAAQASWNGGAWLIEPDEQALLDAEANAPRSAYFPAPAERRSAESAVDGVTEAIAAQYRDWPYPPWSRVTRPRPETLPSWVEALDRGRPSGLPVAADLLVAGCGTGREAAFWALRFPDARITAIDLSQSSLAYARERCAALGLGRIDFRRLDLRAVADLGKTFDFIACSGVLHHMADPEGGWAALTGVLRPGGVMRIMLYSKLGRLKVRAAQHYLADLRDRSADPDLLREARRRVIERAPDLLASWPDFYTLAGVHDLLLNRHEDPFDVPRIARALDRLGLELLAFELPTPWHRARYREENPGDPAFRDVAAWAALELREPFLFEAMYEFACRKPAA